MRIPLRAALVGLALPLAALAQTEPTRADPQQGETTATKAVGKTEKLWRVECSGIGG